MPNSLTADDVIEKGELSAFFVGVSASELLDSLYGDDLTIEDVALSAIELEDADGDEVDGELEVSSISVNTEEYTDPDTGEAYAAGEVFFFFLSGGTLGQTYRIVFLVETSGVPAQFVEAIIPVEMVG